MPMDKRAFSDTNSDNWWLVNDAVEPLQTERLALATAFGWDQSWYTRTDVLEQLYDWVAAQTSRALLEDLERADSTELRRIWVTDLTELRRREQLTAPEPPDEGPADPPAGTVEQQPISSESSAPPVEAKAARSGLFSRTSEAVDAPAPAPVVDEAAPAPVVDEAAPAPVIDEQAAEEAKKLLDDAKLPEPNKQQLEEWVADTAIPIDVADLAKAVEEDPDVLGGDLQHELEEIDLSEFWDELEQAGLLDDDEDDEVDEADGSEGEEALSES